MERNRAKVGIVLVSFLGETMPYAYCGLGIPIRLPSMGVLLLGKKVTQD